MESFYDFLALVVAPVLRRLDAKYKGISREFVTIHWSPTGGGDLFVEAIVDAWATVIVQRPGVEMKAAA
jgi:hypothetical protein